MLKREFLWKPLVCLFAALCLVLGVGSLWDMPLATALYGNGSNLPARVLAAVGELPAYTLLATAGAVWLRRRGRSRRWKEVLALVGGIGLIVFSAVRMFLEIMEDLPELTYVDGAVITVLVFVVAVFLGLLLTREASRSDCFRFFLCVVFVCGFAMFITSLVKDFWARPRPWYLLEEETVSFMPWWKPGTVTYPSDAPYKASRSFPSGHTAIAACSLLWTLFPSLHRRFEGRGRVLFFASCAFTALVALSRLTLGAHFLSDVTATWLFTAVLYILSQLLFYNDGFVFRVFYRFLT